MVEEQDRLKATIEDLDAENARMGEIIDQQAAALRHRAAQIVTLTSERDAARAQVDRDQATIERLRQRIEDGRNRRVDLEFRIAALELGHQKIINYDICVWAGAELKINATGGLALPKLISPSRPLRPGGRKHSQATRR